MGDKTLKKPANTPKTEKRKAPATAWKKGQSGNPKGAPKRGFSFAELIKHYGDMTPSEASAASLEMAKQFMKIGDGITLKEAVVLRVYGALLFDPNPGLLNAFMDRVEGKVKQAVEMTWQEEAKKDGVDPDKIKASLVAEFVAAMDGSRDGGGVSGSEAADAEQAGGDG